MPRTAAALTIAAILGAGLAGCGSSDSTVQGAAAAYFHDLGNENYTDACTLLTDDLRRQLGDCPAALRKRHGGLPRESRDQLRYATVSGVHIKGNTATVTNTNVKVDKTTNGRKTKVRSIGVYQATDGHGMTLVKSGGKWRVSGGGV